MDPIRVFAIISWLLLPTVAFGGYALVMLMTRGRGLTSFEATYFRAGHGHAGDLLVLSLVYYYFLGRTSFPVGVKWVACFLVLIGLLMLSGGFFLHRFVGQEGRSSPGITMTTVASVILSVAMFMLAYGLITA